MALDDLTRDSVQQAQTEPTAWLLVAFEQEDRDHAGNAGYEDDPKTVYRYDSKVQNSKQVAAGDIAILRSKKELLGIARIERIDAQPGIKLLLRCPACQKTQLSKLSSGAFRCRRCGEETTSPVEDRVKVIKYDAQFEDSFVPASGVVSVQELTAACPRYTKQLSMQRIDLSRIPPIAKLVPPLLDPRTHSVGIEAGVTGISRAMGSTGSAKKTRSAYKNVTAPSSPPREPFPVDPDKVDRGNRGHAETQNAVADHLRSLGIKPLKPKGDDPEFDLAWKAGGIFYVAEVKSVTIDNEEKQLRLGLGQVLRYRHKLVAEEPSVIAVLVPERQPSDPCWATLCRDLGVVLAWPGSFETTLPGES